MLEMEQIRHSTIYNRDHHMRCRDGILGRNAEGYCRLRIHDIAHNIDSRVD